MNLLLELDKLLPFCHDPVIGDAVLSKCEEMLLDDKIALGDRLLKLADAFRLANNALRVRLLPTVRSSVSVVTIDADIPEMLISRLVMLWECDDPYSRALCCLLYQALQKFILHSVEIWYRLRQSVLSDYAIEQRAAMQALSSFYPNDDSNVPLNLQEMVADAIAYRKSAKIYCR